MCAQETCQIRFSGLLISRKLASGNAVAVATRPTRRFHVPDGLRLSLVGFMVSSTHGGWASRPRVLPQKSIQSRSGNWLLNDCLSSYGNSLACASPQDMILRLVLAVGFIANPAI